MLIQEIKQIAVDRSEFGMEEEGKKTFDGCVYLVEITAKDLEEECDFRDLDFPVCQLKQWGGENLQAGFYSVAALEGGTFNGNEILNCYYHNSIDPAMSALTQLIKEWHKESASLLE